MKPAPRPFPTLLNKSDALAYAASRLEEEVANLELIAILSDAMKSVPASTAPNDESRAALEHLRTAASGIMDKDIQAAAMKAAAADIRALANETKLAEARAAREGIGAPR